MIVSDLQGNKIMKMERPCQCTIWCCNRPMARVYKYEKGFVNNERIEIGKVTVPWKCCDKNLDIYGKDEDKVMMNVTGSCCQLGFLCSSCPCDACQ
jgi:hypothetical protein